MKLLAIDIGNTSITCGMFNGARLGKRFGLPTARYDIAALKRAFGKQLPDQIIISSVVPRISGLMERDFPAKLGIKPYILGRNLAVPIKNAYRKPKQVGQDRLVNAYAGIQLYGKPLVVIDFGTAVTFDCISRKGEYLGGMILPGMGISLEALFRRTALLPAVKLAPPREFIGRETKTSILSGIVYGMAALADDLSQRIKTEIGASARIIGTGGNIGLLARYCNKIDAIDPDLTLKGLQLIHSGIR